MFFNTAALVAVAFAAGANAHMYLSSPTPIEGNAIKDPLDPSGSNFPCHGVSIPTSGGQKMAAGSSQVLSFELGGGANTAVHGGGSCQMSVTYETDPAKVKDPKNWYVIYSIEGGCPSNTAGNLDGSYTGPSGTYSGALSCNDPKTNGVDCVNEFNYTIPNGLKNGHATFAWTWYNTIGNRELYMNCISAEISGGDGSEMSELPSMFVANMASINSCPTTEQTNVKFPVPGKYVMTKLPSGANAKAASQYPIAAPSGASCASDGAVAGGPAAGGSTPPKPHGSAPAAPSSAPAQSSAPAASAPASGSAPAYGSAPAPSSAHAPSGSAGSGLVTITTMQTVTSGSVAAPSAPASAVPSAAPSEAAPSSAAPAPSSYAPSPSGTSSSGSCANSAVACTNPGGVVCIGTAQFGLCNINNCAVPQALAAGTHCEAGEIRKRDNVRRHLSRHARRHANVV
ncbi:hypothetical protein LTR09_001869 [Extremus antarcticus]|uniref:Lytic polysaccharide monooxygenase n=1 Tax=Extremus antarcticus TaxID=702011 RepID=A0AAJ0GHN9_9PEZI|nr:hypothetical protein LTR09_001869 [Extremus antarcticus]